MPRPATAPATPPRPWTGRVAGSVVCLLAGVFGFHKIDDFDTWWHLAAGRWIAVNHTIPATDTLSHTVRDHVWINLQWGFDLGLYALLAVGGTKLLTVASAIVFAATVVLLLRLIARPLGGSLGALLMLLVVLAAQERVTLRPELLSFLLLAAVLSVLERGRRFDGRGLFLLVPLMIVWVNVHALFIVGAFAIVCAAVGSLTMPSRKLLIWGGIAIAAVIVNPFGVQGVLFPLTLMSRISGSHPVFQAVGEFGSPFADGAAGVAVTFYMVVLAVAGVAALLALFIRGRRLDWGGVIFVAGLAALSIAARRNIALFALGSAPFIAQWLAIVLDASPRLRAFAVRRASLAAAVAGMGAIAIATTVVTGAFYKFDNAPQEFGTGVIDGAFPMRASMFARAAALPGKLYNDMAAGGYLASDDPIGDGVFVDGRLEVYDTPFLTEYVTAVADPIRWQSEADRYGIQTAIIFHRFENDRVLAGRLFQNPAWALVYVDEVAAIFVRAQGNDAALARAAALRPRWDATTEAWLTRPIQKWPWPAGRVEGTRAYARFLSTIGRAEPAIAAYLSLFELGVSKGEEIERRLLIARYFASHGRTSEAQEQARRVLAIDPDNADARRLLQ